MASELLPPGTCVEFDSDGEGSTPLMGVVLSYMPQDEESSEGYHVACYYVVSSNELTVSPEEDKEFLALQKQTGPLCQKTGLDYHTVSDLLVKGWRYVEKIGEISRWEHPMWALDKPHN